MFACRLFSRNLSKWRKETSNDISVYSLRLTLNAIWPET